MRDCTADFNAQKYAEFFNKALLKNFISYINIFTTYKVSIIQEMDGLNEISHICIGQYNFSETTYRIYTCRHKFVGRPARGIGDSIERP